MSTRIIAWAVDAKHDQPDETANGTETISALKARSSAEWHARMLELYDALHPSLYKYLRTLGLSTEEGEDVIQEAFLRLANLLRQGGKDDNLRSWLFRVAHNCAMDIHRGHSTQHTATMQDDDVLEDIPDPSMDPEWMYLEKEQMQRMNAAIAELTPQQRNGLLLRSEGLRYAEIGGVLGVSESRAIYLVKRALQKLAERI